MIVATIGCSGVELDTTYGRRRGTRGGRSVNGTMVLAAMFREAGYHVSTKRELSSKLEQFDVIVWIPNSFEPPDEVTIEFLDEWLDNADSRTLIYVGRDYDAAADYWTKAAAAAPAGEVAPLQRRRAEAMAEHDASLGPLPSEESCQWFTMRRDGPPQRVSSLEGPLAEGIDPALAEIMLHTKIELDPSYYDDDYFEFDTLLGSQSEPIVMRRLGPTWYGEAQLIVVANGSFLLNLPLVNHEHRKLAGRLIAECGDADRVAFLESGPFGMMVSGGSGEYPTGLEALTVWPLNIVLLHLAVVGILYCCYRFPVFGRPRQLAPPPPTDFGNHIKALGELLGQAGNRADAENRLRRYQQQARRDSGVSHLRTVGDRQLTEQETTKTTESEP